MYTPSHFSLSEQQAFELLKQNLFGQLSVVANDDIEIGFFPFELDNDNRCLFVHLAKQNPLVEALIKNPNATLSFLGDHTYISPNWYICDQQVPTWNYQAVEIKARAVQLSHSETVQLIDRLSQFHEAQFEKPWTLDKLAEKKLNAMSRAIVGFRLDIIQITGKSKMSQNKSNEERQSLINGLNQQSDNTSQSIASLIEKEIKNESAS